MKTIEVRPSLKSLVAMYKAAHKGPAEELIRWFERRSTLQEALELGVLSRVPSRHNSSHLIRYSHQRRIPAQALEHAHELLRRAHVDRCGSFAELHELIAALIGGIYRIGELTTYDIATRIGAYLRLRPERVYLHAGTRIGARALGLPASQPSLAIAQLPVELHELSAAEIEDFLCIFNSCF